MLRERVGLLDVVEEATVDERHEHARSGKSRLHRLPLLVGEVRFRCHLPQYRSTLIAGHVDRGADTRLPAGRGSRRLSERKIHARNDARRVAAPATEAFSRFTRLGRGAQSGAAYADPMRRTALVVLGSSLAGTRRRLVAEAERAAPASAAELVVMTGG